MKYRKLRKTLTKEEAQNKIQSTKMMIETLQEAIHTWQNNAPVGIIACVIQSEFGSVQKAIDYNQNKIEWCNQKIKDLTRFL